MSLNHKMTSGERRAAIIKAGIRLFAERGFRGTTTRALADAVGVSEPVLYEHFKSKRDLYFAIVDAKSSEGTERAFALLQPRVQAKDDRAVFTALGHFILDLYSEDPDYLRLLIFVALEDPELGATFYQRQRQARECLAGYIQERVDAGAFRKVDPRLAVRAFLGMLSHHAQVEMLYRDDFVKCKREEVVEGMVDIFLNGICNKGNGGK